MGIVSCVHTDLRLRENLRTRSVYTFSDIGVLKCNKYTEVGPVGSVSVRIMEETQSRNEDPQSLGVYCIEISYLRCLSKSNFVSSKICTTFTNHCFKNINKYIVDMLWRIHAELKADENSREGIKSKCGLLTNEKFHSAIEEDK